MYLRHYGFIEEPFGVTPDPRFLYLGASHREALASLLHGIQTGRGFMVLIAAPGMGKTTLITEVLERTRSIVRSAVLFQTQCSRQELLRYLLNDLGVPVDSDDVVAMHEQFNQALVENYRAGRRVVIVIDEAHNLSNEVLESIRLLSDFETPQEKLLQIILSGQPQLGVKLASPEQWQLRQRISIVSQIKPLSVEEVLEYVETRLRVAGRHSFLFTPEAIEAISIKSDGIPRIINNYCFNLLSLAYALQRDEIGVDLVDEVSNDLDFATKFDYHGEGAFAYNAPPKFKPRRASNGAQPSSRSHTRFPNSPEATSVPVPEQVGSSSSQIRTIPLTSGTSALRPEAFPEPTQREQTLHAVPPAPAAAGAAAAAVQPQAANPPASAALGRMREAAATKWAAQERKEPAGERNRRVIAMAMIAVALLFTIGIVVAAIRFGGTQKADATPPSQTVITDAPVLPEPAATDPRGTPASAKHGGAEPKTEKSKHRSSTAAKPTIADDPVEVITRFVPPATPPPTAQNQQATSILPAPALPAASLQPTEIISTTISAATPIPTFAGDARAPEIVPGKLLRRIPPVYPSVAKAARLEGAIALVAEINEQGTVTSVAVEDGTGVLAAAAVDAVKQWRYSPFTLNGKPVPASARITINFRL